jgi:hypothetical protein
MLFQYEDKTRELQMNPIFCNGKDNVLLKRRDIATGIYPVDVMSQKH